jgi:hypothetical protein
MTLVILFKTPPTCQLPLQHGEEEKVCRDKVGGIKRYGETQMRVLFGQELLHF